MYINVIDMISFIFCNPYYNGEKKTFFDIVLSLHFYIVIQELLAFMFLLVEFLFHLLE